MSVTELVKAACLKTLNAHAREIDAGGELVSISLIVKMNQRTGKPHRVLYRTESETDLYPRDGRLQREQAS